MKYSVKTAKREFPDGPVVKTPRFHCRGAWVPFLVGELRSHKLRGMAKKNTFIYLREKKNC